MRYGHKLAAALAVISAGLGVFAACVGDSSTTNPDATTDSGGGPETSTGCTARTADDTAGIFVAQTGSDVSGCGTRANPCKTLTYSVALAKASSSKTALYVAAPPATDAGAGAYQESIIIDIPLTIEGGWKDSAGTWTPICDTTTSTAVTIQGTTNTTITASFTGTATLRDLRVISKAAADPGESLYGVFVLGAATNITLDQVVAEIAAGGAGANGTDGTNGANATDAGCTASTGANGDAGTTGAGGAAGTFASSGYLATNGGDAGNGGTGNGGTAGGAASCQTCQTFAGSCPSSCGFGQTQGCSGAGLSGCGGAGGVGGGYGSGGGASVAVFVWDAKVTVFGGSYTTGNGGNGGNGGSGADGGAGAAGAAGADKNCPTSLSNPTCILNSCSGTLNSSVTLTGGSAGGTGGAGGVGGQGGGGSGGMSYDIVQGGAASVALNGNPKLIHGTGGTGGAAGGANGLAADKWP